MAISIVAHFLCGVGLALYGRLKIELILICGLLTSLPAFVSHIYYEGEAVVWLTVSAAALMLLVWLVGVANLLSRRKGEPESGAQSLIGALIFAGALCYLAVSGIIRRGGLS